MEIDFTLINLIDFLGAVQGTLLGALLLLQGRKHVSYFLLGLFLIGYSLELFTTVFEESNFYQEYPLYLFLPLNFYLLFMPSLYLYAQSLTRKMNWRKDFFHFLPAVFEFLIFTILFFQKNKYVIYESEVWEIFESIYMIIAWILVTGYAIAIIRFVNGLKKRVENFYSNPQGKLLHWVKWVATFVVIFNVAMILSNSVSDEMDEGFFVPFMSAINVVFIFWVALSGFRQVQVELPAVDFFDKKIETETIESKNNIPNEDFDRLKKYLTVQKSFKNPKLHLALLAKELNISQRKLSTLINENAQLNFNQFINQYRIEEAKQLLVDENFAHLNMVGIAYEVGFNSKATFYAVFKKMTGTTPIKFQKMKLLAP